MVWDGRLQRRIPSQVRATVTSVRGFLVEIDAVLVYLFFGGIAQGYDNRTAFLFFAAVTLLIAPAGLLLKSSTPPPQYGSLR